MRGGEGANGTSFFSQPLLTCHHQASGFFFSGIYPEWGSFNHIGPSLRRGLEQFGLHESSVMEFWEGRGEIKTKFGDMSKSSFLLTLETTFHQ